MMRFLIYLFPAVADVIIAATMFVCSSRLAEAGRSRTEVAMVFAAWAGVYIASSQLLARAVSTRRAAGLMIAGNLLFSAIAAGFILAESIWAIYALMGLLAVASALFFLPFQIFMKAVEPDEHQGVVRSVAMYTFSWSIGFACGPFIAGFIYQGFGWQWCFVFTGILGLAVACGVHLLKHHAKDHPVQPAPCVGDTGEVNYHTMPDLVWLGWVVAGVGCLGIYAFLALLPSAGTAFAIPTSQVGSIIGVLYVVQALVGLSLMRSRTWMYRRGPTMAFAASGLVGLVFFGTALLSSEAGSFPTWLRVAGLYASAACYGVFSGSFFFGLVFHSLVHPQRSARYVAVNETIVGVCGTVGPVLAGLVADRFGFTAFALIQMTLIAGVILLEGVALRRPVGKVVSTL